MLLKLQRTRMSTKDARELQRQAEARARDLEVDRMIRFVLANSGNANYREQMKHQPLPGTGYIMAADFTGLLEYETKVYDAMRPVVNVYQATSQGQNIVRFNDGLWVVRLAADYEWLMWAATHETAAGIVENFAPLGDES